MAEIENSQKIKVTEKPAEISKGDDVASKKPQESLEQALESAYMDEVAVKSQDEAKGDK